MTLEEFLVLFNKVTSATSTQNATLTMSEVCLFFNKLFENTKKIGNVARFECSYKIKLVFSGSVFFRTENLPTNHPNNDTIVAKKKLFISSFDDNN
jgi:hypothetical protein